MRITNTHVYFWGSIFSNFFNTSFTYKGLTFNSSEQAFMWEKAHHFGDTATCMKILNTTNPKEAKALGRSVKPFRPEEWDKVSYGYMLAVVTAKFSQNEKLKSELLKHKDKIFVEASPFDIIYGVGLREDDPLILNEANWKGQNRLGKVLNEVIDILA